MKTFADLVKDFESVKRKRNLFKACRKIELTDEEAEVISKVLELVYGEGHNNGYDDGWQEAQEEAWERHGILIM